MLDEIATHISAALKKDGIAAARALEIGTEAVARLDDTFAGTMLYWPKGRSEKATDRHEEIARAFNGTNVAELAARFNMTEPSIYRVLKQARDARRRAPVPPNVSRNS